MPRITKVYTRTGDDGTTRLGSGQRVPKDSLAHRGVRHGRRAQQPPRRGARRGPRSRACREAAAHDPERALPPGLGPLHPRGGQGAAAGAADRGAPRRRAREADGRALRGARRRSRTSSCPGGSPGAAALHVARTVCRRAERLLVALAPRRAGRRAHGRVPEPALRRALRHGALREPPARRAGRPLEQPGLGAGAAGARALVRWSSGKDSAWALRGPAARSRLEIAGLLTTAHRGLRPRLDARRARGRPRPPGRGGGLPCRKVRIRAGCVNADYERAMGEAVARRARRRHHPDRLRRSLSGGRPRLSRADARGKRHRRRTSRSGGGHREARDGA